MRNRVLRSILQLIRVLLFLAVIISLSASMPFEDAVEESDNDEIENEDTSMEEEESDEGLLFQGDILRDTIDEGKENQAVLEDLLWPDGVVKYWIDGSIKDSTKKQMIRNAISMIESVSCVKFVERKRKIDHHFIKIYRGPGETCSSLIGMSHADEYYNLGQPLRLDEKCFTNRTILHELMHALGFHHEQARTDRDQFVEILLENVEERGKHNFGKTADPEVTHLGTAYDYHSIMHYRWNDYSVNENKPTIKIRQEGMNNKILGTSESLSSTDITEINRLYKCPGYESLHDLVDVTSLTISPDAILPKTAPTGADCLELHEKFSNLKSGIYTLTPPGIANFSAYCDMDTDGGGWTVFQRRMDNSLTFYDKTWIEYKNGFNNGLDNSLWLGNDKIHVLSTKDANVELRIDVWGDRAPGATNPNVYLYKKYTSFSIDNEANYYTLHISSSSTGNASTTSGSIYYNNGKFFSTIDVNHGNYTCSGTYGLGGWWLGYCTWVCLNGKYIPLIWHSYYGFTWNTGSTYYNPAQSRMMLRKLGIRMDNSLTFYDKTWIEYKNGFNNGLDNSLWLGNDKIHVLSTKDANVELRIDVWGDRAPGATNPNVYLYGKYESFSIDNEANYYTFHISSSSTGNASVSTTNKFYYNNGNNFSTIDVSNDYHGGNCFNELGGWWLWSCTSYVCLNGKYIPEYWHRDYGFVWYTGNAVYNPAQSRMMLRKLGM